MTAVGDIENVTSVSLNVSVVIHIVSHDYILLRVG